MKRSAIAAALVPIALALVASCTRLTVQRPEGFAEIQARPYYDAVSPEGMRLQVYTVRNYPRQTAAFWSDALRMQLLRQGYSLLHDGERFDATGGPGMLFEWAMRYGGQSWIYATAIVVGDDLIAVAECAAEHTIYGARREAIRQSLPTIDPRRTSETPKRPASSATAPASAQQRPSGGGGGCFPPGTLVLTSAGPLPIQDVTPGTRVAAYDSERRAWTTGVVQELLSQRYDGSFVAIVAGGASVRATANHPFWVAAGERLADRPVPRDLPGGTRARGGRWVEAGDLRVGDSLLTKRGTVRVERLEVEAGASVVYNATVPDLHTYTVGIRGLLVHNKGKAESAAPRGERPAAPAALSARLDGLKAALAAVTL